MLVFLLFFNVSKHYWSTPKYVVHSLTKSTKNNIYIYINSSENKRRIYLNYKFPVCVTFSAVPQPTVIFRGNDSAPVYAGTEFVLNISITFSDKKLIDVDNIFTFVLSRGNMSSDEQANNIINDDRITLLTDNEMDMASLTYSPIAITDSGWITATVTVSPCNNSFIQPITATSSYSLHVEGKIPNNLMDLLVSVVKFVNTFHVMIYNYFY